MKKLLSTAAALTVTIGLGACSTFSAPTSSPLGSTSTAATGPASPTAPTPADPSSGATGTAPAGTADSSAPAKQVDQSTPEAAMTSWLTAMLDGDGATVCGLMASGDTAIADLPAAQTQCAGMIAPMLEQLSAVKDMFKGLQVTGATVNGDTATFEKAKTTPALAATIIASLKAVNLGEKWYVTEG